MNIHIALCFGVLLIVGLNGGSAVKYELKKDSKSCIILDTVAIVSVSYFNTDGKQVAATWSLPAASSINGHCDFDSVGGQASSMNLTFPDHWLELQFANQSGRAYLTAMSLSVNVQNGSRFVNPNATGLRLLTSKPDWRLSSDTEYFACTSTIQLRFAEAPADSSLSLANTRLQAFNVENDSFSEQVATCNEDETTAASTLTIAPTTEASTTESSTITTAAPTTDAPATSTAAPTTTSAPAPPPLVNLTLLDPTTKAPCLSLQLRATFAITYTLKAGGNATVAVALPGDARVSNGDCGNASQFIWADFYQGAWALEVTFTKQDAKGFALRYLQLRYQLSPDRFPNAAEPGKIKNATGNQTYFSVTSGTGDYFMCSVKQRFTLDASVAMETQDLRAQAFRTNNGSDTFFGTPVDCVDDTPIDNVVPIVVGSALAGLVLIVLVAYLIGRRRHSSGGGYQSV